jgi:hypothetical protein
MRLHIYDVNENGYPGVELLNRDVIINNDNFKKGYLIIDVRDQNILVNGKAFFVGVQWITPYNNINVKGFFSSSGIGETTKLTSVYSYHNFTGNPGEWFTFYEHGKVLSSGEVENWGGKDSKTMGNPVNMLASVDVIFF